MLYTMLKFLTRFSLNRACRGKITVGTKWVGYAGQAPKCTGRLAFATAVEWPRRKSEQAQAERIAPTRRLGDKRVPHEDSGLRYSVKDQYQTKSNRSGNSNRPVVEKSPDQADFCIARNRFVDLILAKLLCVTRSQIAGQRREK